MSSEQASASATVPESSRQAGALAPAEPGEVRVRRALISVHDKAGVVELARGLRDLGVELVSTGGTARALGAAGVELRAIDELTGFPEIMGGRVKTLHPRLYGGLLARRDDHAHVAAAEEHAIEQVDLVCVNLYPFERTVAGGADAAEAIENIDIGGPTMIRAAAKNHPFVVVLVDPADYGPVLEELRTGDGRLSLATRERLAARAFAYTARYDAAIARWFAPRAYGEGFPPRWASAFEKVADLRYGENPHQRAAFYAEVGGARHLLDGVRQLQGKELSFNNLLDMSAALELVEELDVPGRDGAAVAIVKHNNPCGCALGASAAAAYERALASDPQSAFGGIIAVDERVDLAFAQALGRQFVEVLLAPGFDEDALAELSQKKNLRLLERSPWPRRSRGEDPQQPSVVEKPVRGGVLSQTRDAVTETRADMRVLTGTPPSEQQWRDLEFAWRVCLHVRSNAIVLASGEATIGVGAGQMSRVDSVRIAVEKARASQPQLLPGCALASDAFFPFADNIELAAEAGVGAIIQPGGSVRDDEVIAAAAAAGITMVLTGVRHFRH